MTWFWRAIKFCQYVCACNYKSLCAAVTICCTQTHRQHLTSLYEQFSKLNQKFCSCEGRARERSTHSTAEYAKEASEYIGCRACISYKPPLMTIGQDAQRSQLASDSHQLAMLIVFVLLNHANVAWSRWRAMIRQIKQMNNRLTQCFTQNIGPRLFLFFFQELKIIVMARNVTKTLLL